jgi:hypothetical protein
MITYGHLVARISRRLRAKPAGPPTPDIPAAPRRRPARVTAALTTLPVAAATIATAALLPWAVARDTAYIASHLTRAPSAVPAGTIMNVQVRRSGSPRGVMEVWAGDDKLRIEDFPQAGKPAYDSGYTRTRTAFTQVTVNYPHKTWTRQTGTPGGPRTPSLTCANATADFYTYVNPSQEQAAWLRTAVSCGTLKPDGTTTIDGVTTIRLAPPPGKAKNTSFTLYVYVNPKTYLPVRQTATGASGQVMQVDYQWLPPTAANLAKLNLPAIPPGFTQAPG